MGKGKRAMRTKPVQIYGSVRTEDDHAVDDADDEELCVEVPAEKHGQKRQQGEA